MKFANKVVSSPFLNRNIQWSAPQLAPAAIDQAPVFSGNTSEFKEWVFAMDLPLKALAFEDAEERVGYAASFLKGNTRLWLIASQ